MCSSAANRRTGKGWQVSRTLWSRIPPALQLTALFPLAIGGELAAPAMLRSQQFHHATSVHKDDRK